MKTPPMTQLARYRAVHRIAGVAARLTAVGVAGALPTAAMAATEQKPLWEFGLGIGALGFADYRGASTDSVYPVPVPYFVYRGKFLQADREGIRGLFFNGKYVEVNLSVNATTPVRGSSRGARAGMASLRPTFEIGPSIDVHLWQSGDSRHRLDLRLPVRSAFTAEAAPRRVGWLFTPNLNLDIVDPGGFKGWNLGFVAGPVFAERRYHEYFYSVSSADATASRPAYAARGGYGGTQFIMSASKRFTSRWVGAFIRHDTLAGARFLDSPLVRTRQYWSAGVGVAWMIGKSAQWVDVDAEHERLR